MTYAKVVLSFVMLCVPPKALTFSSTCAESSFKVQFVRVDLINLSLPYSIKGFSFVGLSGDHFRFDSNGDGPARYNIIHFKQLQEGQYNWVKVGEYYEGELRLNMTGNEIFIGK